MSWTDTGRRQLHWLLFAAATVWVLLSQAELVGFTTGHHGWESAQYPAIASHASSETGFVGYSQRLMFATGKIEYDYFCRVPFPVPAIHNSFLLSRGVAPSTRVLVTRQWMNLVVMATLALAWAVGRRLGASAPIAMAAAFVAVSGRYWMHYKDVALPDILTVAGFLLLIVGIHDYRTRSRSGPLVAVVVVASSIGWGYSTLSVLGAWAMWESIEAWHRGERRLWRLRSVHVSLLALVLTLGYIGHNTWMEARVRGVPIAETGVVKSVRLRLMLDSGFNQKNDELLRWDRFSARQFERIRESFGFTGAEGESPWQYGVRKGLNGILLGSGLFLFARSLRRRRHRGKDSTTWLGVTLLAFSGPLWLFPMRNLAEFHDYTAVCYLGIPLAFYLFAWSGLERRLQSTVLVLAWLGFCFATAGVDAVPRGDLERWNAPTYDFDRIEALLPSDAVVCYPEGYRNVCPGSPYAVNLYLQETINADRRCALAQFAVSADPRWGPDNLTPDNSGHFLFRLSPGSVLSPAVDPSR